MRTKIGQLYTPLMKLVPSVLDCPLATRNLSPATVFLGDSDIWTKESKVLPGSILPCKLAGMQSVVSELGKW